MKKHCAIPDGEFLHDSVHGGTPSSEANSSSASQKIHRILWSPKVQYRIHKKPSLLLIPSQTNPIHVQSYVLRIHFNIILPCTSRFPNRLFPSGYPAKPCMHLSSTSYGPRVEFVHITLNSGLKRTRGHGTAKTNWIALYDYFNINDHNHSNLSFVVFRGFLSL
jgi:hypothetical protein